MIHIMCNLLTKIDSFSQLPESAASPDVDQFECAKCSYKELRFVSDVTLANGFVLSVRCMLLLEFQVV